MSLLRQGIIKQHKTQTQTLLIFRSGPQYFRDVSFYDSDTLSLLLEEVPREGEDNEDGSIGAPTLAQLHLPPIGEHFIHVPYVGAVRENTAL